MDLKDCLTNENVSKKFKSQFELVNYAIQLAANMIHTGRESRVKIDSQNRAMHVLTEILQDKDRFDEIVPKEVVIVAPVMTLSFDDDEDEDDEDEDEGVVKKAKKTASKSAKSSSKTAAKASDKKKPRKILA